MKILIIPTAYPDESNPIRNIFISEQAAALANNGYDIRILHVKKFPSRMIFDKIDYKIKIYYDKQIKRYCLPIKTFKEDIFVWWNKRIFIAAVDKLYKYIIDDGWTPDVIYAHFSCWAGYAAIKLGQKYHIPVSVMEHFSGFMSNNIDHRLIQGLKYTVNNADAFICVSEKLKKSVICNTGTKKSIFVISNMIDPGFHFFERPANEKFIFSSVCNLIERKRIKELVFAFCKAFSNNDNVELIIGGDGPEKNKIIEYIKTKKRENQIKLLGRLDREETIELYKRSNCFVLVSAHETFGIVWREAMATGLPVITSNHEGWSENEWSDDFGIMVSVDDETSLVTALQKMRNHCDIFNGNNISAYCKAHYSEDILVSQLEMIFNKLLCNYW